MMFACLLFAAVSNAEVIITKGGQQVKMEDGAIVATDGVQETEINYAGLKVAVPADVKVVVRQDADGNVVINGSKLSNVKISNLTVNTDVPTTLVINRNSNTLKVTEGNIEITNASGKTSAMRTGQTAMMVALPKPAAQTLSKEEQEAQEKAAKEKAKQEEKAAKEKAKQEAKAAKAAAKAEAKAAKEAAKAAKATASETSSVTDTEIPSFVDTTATESAANEQAVENIIEAEEDLSPSAPRL